MKMRIVLIGWLASVPLLAVEPEGVPAPKTPSAADAAVGLVVKQWPQVGKTLTPLRVDCVSFTPSPDPDVPRAIDIEVREKHDQSCGGDPDTAPRVGALRVLGGRVYQWDASSDQYLPWSKVLD